MLTLVNASQEHNESNIEMDTWTVALFTRHGSYYCSLRNTRILRTWICIFLVPQIRRVASWRATFYVCHPPCVLDKWQQPLVHMKSVTTCWVDQEARPVDRSVLVLKSWGKLWNGFGFPGKFSGAHARSGKEDMKACACILRGST